MKKYFLSILFLLTIFIVKSQTFAPDTLFGDYYVYGNYEIGDTLKANNIIFERDTIFGNGDTLIIGLVLHGKDTLTFLATKYDLESAGFWEKTYGHIYPKTITDSVGIGTNSPTEMLDINGNSLIRDTLFLSLTEFLREETHGSLMITTDKSVLMYSGSGEYKFGSGETVFKYNTNDQFRFSPSTIRHIASGSINSGKLRFPVLSLNRDWFLPDKTGTIALLDDISDSTYWDRADGHIYPKTITDSIGIGTNSPTEMLDVNGRVIISDELTVGSRIGSVGTNSVVFGSNNEASGFHSIAWGDNTASNGNTSTAWGYNTVSSSELSTAWGDNTTASSNNSTAWGFYTIAKSESSTAYGKNTTASGENSTAWGFYTKANSYLETVLGMCNDTTNSTESGIWESTDNLFVVGNGSDVSHRNNAFTILKNGNATFDANLMVEDTLMVGDVTSPTNIFEVENLFKDDIVLGNLFIGDSAGHSNTNGFNNVFIGNESGIYNITGKRNVYIGFQAGKFTDASQGVYIGYEAGKYAQEDGQLFIGKQAGQNTTTGGANQFLGKEAGRYNISGSHNTTFGRQTLRIDTSGDYNIAIGNNAMQMGMNNFSNIAIGFSALLGNSVNNSKHNIAIGNGAGVSNMADYNIFIGDSAGYFNTNGYANNFQGYQAGYSNTTGSNNIFQGYRAGYNNLSGYNNIFQGYRAGYSNTEGNYNIFQGSNAGYSNTTGNWNIFQGYQTGYLNTTGHDNIFQGNHAGFSNSTGNDNIFQGNHAGFSNSTGNNNIFQGHYAGYLNTTGYNNIFIGGAAGYSNTTGNFNIFQGSNAGMYNTTGNNNIFQGHEAGYRDTSGSNNVYIGYQSGHDNLAGINNIYLGYRGGYHALDSNKLYIENSDSSTPLIWGDFVADVIIINGNFGIDSSLIYADCETLADDGIIDLPAGKEGVLMARVSDGIIDAHIEVSCFSDGSISQIVSRGTTAFADSDGFLCVFDNGTNVRIKNRLGYQLRICYEFKTYR